MTGTLDTFTGSTPVIDITLSTDTGSLSDSGVTNTGTLTDTGVLTQ